MKKLNISKIDKCMIFMTLFNILCYFSFILWFGTTLHCYLIGESYTTFCHYFFLFLTIVLYFVSGYFHDCAYVRRDQVVVLEEDKK